MHSLFKTHNRASLILVCLIVGAVVYRATAFADSSILVSGLPFYQIFSAESDRTSLVAKNNFLFWSDSGESAVSKIPFTGGVATPLAMKTGVVENVASLNGDLIFIEERSGFGVSGCAGSLVQKLLRKRASDGTVTTLATGDNCPASTNDL